MSAVKKVVDILWYSANHKDRKLANELAAEVKALENRIKELESRLTQRAPDLASVSEIQKLCANCHQYHSVTVACTPSG